MLKYLNTLNVLGWIFTLVGVFVVLTLLKYFIGVMLLIAFIVAIVLSWEKIKNVVLYFKEEK